MKICGIEGMSPAELHAAIEQGGRFVMYKYCVSLLVITFRRPTDVYFVKAGESRVTPGLPWTLLTFFLGWWGIPWGPIYSVQCLHNNLSGGQDVTGQVQSSLSRPLA